MMSWRALLFCLLTTFTVSSWAAPDLIDHDEELFYRELRIEADAFYEDFKTQIPQVKKSQWSSTMNFVVLKLRQGREFKTVIKRYAKTSVFPLLVTSVLTSVVIPAFSAWYQTSFGVNPTLTAITGLIIAFPFTPFVIAGSVWMKRRTFSKQMKQELGIETLDDLHRLREEVLGFDLRTRLLSASFDSLEENAARVFELEVLSRRNGVIPSPGTVTVGELEELIRNSGARGRAYLEATYLKQANKALYPQLLLLFIQEDAELGGRLSRRLNISTAGRSSSAQRAFLVSLQEALQEIATHDRLLDRAARALKPKLNDRERPALKAFGKAFVRSSSELEWQIHRQELAYLHALSQGQDPDPSIFSEGLRAELSRRRALVRDIESLALAPHPTFRGFAAPNCGASLQGVLNP